MSFEKGTKGSRAKRQRTAPPTPATVHNLSADLWCIIADFLPKTSRALLAVALTAPSASFRASRWNGQPNAVSMAIISSVKDQVSPHTLLDELCEEARGETRRGRGGSQRRQLRYAVYSNSSYDMYEEDYRGLLSAQPRKYYYYCRAWEVMDFVDIPKSVASRLTDDDIGAILVCIDAKNKLKRLNLTNCFDVVGHGLEPLRSSNVLEILDLGLYRHFETPFWLKGAPKYSFRKIKLSEGPVCDIVDSVLCENGMSFKRLQYPYEFYRKDQLGRDGNLAGIASCDDVDKLMRTGRMKEFVEGHGDAIIWNLFSCCVYFNYDTRDTFCSQMREEDDDDWFEYDLEMTDKCLRCFEKHYAVCYHCDEILCIQCAHTNGCIDCNAIYCLRCKNEGKSDVTYCHSDECRLSEWICKECRLDRCRYRGNNCESCRSMALDTLLDEVDEQREQLDRSKLIMFSRKSPPVTIRIKEPDGEELLVTMEKGTQMETLFQAFAEKHDWDVTTVQFTLRGETIQNDATPESLGLSDMDEIEGNW